MWRCKKSCQYCETLPKEHLICRYKKQIHPVKKGDKCLHMLATTRTWRETVNRYIDCDVVIAD